MLLYLVFHYLNNNITSDAINYVTSSTFIYNGKTLYGFLGSKSQVEFIFTTFKSNIKKILNSLGITESLDTTYDVLTSTSHPVLNGMVLFYQGNLYRGSIGINAYANAKIVGVSHPVIPFFSE